MCSTADVISLSLWRKRSRVMKARRINTLQSGNVIHGGLQYVKYFWLFLCTADFTSTHVTRQFLSQLSDKLFRIFFFIPINRACVPLIKLTDQRLDIEDTGTHEKACKQVLKQRRIIKRPPCGEVK